MLGIISISVVFQWVLGVVGLLKSNIILGK